MDRLENYLENSVGNGNRTGGSVAGGVDTRQPRNQAHMARKRKLHHGRRKRLRKIFSTILVFAAIFLVVGYFFLWRPYGKIATQGKAVVNEAREVKAAFSENDLDKMDSELQELRVTYDGFQKSAKRVYWVSVIPFVGGYAADFKHGVAAGDELIDAAILAADAIAPHADLLGFKKGESTFIEKSAEERIATAVLTLDKILVEADDIAVHVDRARDHLALIDEGRYPEKVGKRVIRDRVKSTKDQFEGVASLFVDALPLIKKFPEIMGAGGEEKMYLVIFANNGELRPVGGFWTAYALFRVNNGRFRVERSEDIYHLDLSIPRHPKAPKEILTYHKGVSTFNIRDSNLSPDLVESIKLFDGLYQQSRNKVDYDGIFVVDMEVLVDVLKVLGPTQASGITFTADIDERCDCPQVIYKLMDKIDRPVAYIKDNRKGLLGELLFVIMQKALGFSPSQYWGRLSQDLIKNMQEKHLLVYLRDPDAQRAIEALNFGGRIREYTGDYLHINDTNFAGAKSNLFVEHTIASETTVKGDGTVERTITIDYKNPHKHSNCSLEQSERLGVGGLCLNATLRNWLRIYVPEGSILVDFKGSETKVRTYDELGKTVFEGFMLVKPLGKASVVVTYTLPFKVDKLKDYKLLIQKQSGAKDHTFAIYLNGKKHQEMPLVKDYEFKIR